MEKQFGKVDVKVEFIEKKLVVTVADAEIGVENITKVDAKVVLEAIKAKIPGQLDDAIIGLLEKALGL